ncbi:MAG: RdgB/HAM1 family non-canonical purine NTP pyrophosphatase [Candidatus Acidiferrales bacterium]|jgi:XTP/dITP diphosphohydrolase
MRLFLASSNSGKLGEYLELARGSGVTVELMPRFAEFPSFDEAAPTFAENSAGKALHYSRYTDEAVLADDSGLVVPALGGAPGVYSARYAGPGATDAERVQKLLREMRGMEGDERRARFVCVTSVAQAGRAIAVVSDLTDGVITSEPRGTGGFGYDPVFLFEELGRTYAELTPGEKNAYSHRGKSFSKLLYVISPSKVGTS